MTRSELEDGGHYFSQKQINLFQEILTKKTGNPEIAREVGRYWASSEAFGAIRQYALGFLTASMAYLLFEKIGANLTRATTFRTKKIGSNKVEVLSIPKAGVIEHPNQCENRQGLFEAMAKVYTNELATIEHPVCVNHGGEHCRYIISWKTTPGYRWKMISRYTLALSLVTFLPLFLFLPSSVWAELLVIPILINTGVILNTQLVEKKEIIRNIQSQSDIAYRLVDQINLRYNEATLIQEIGQATSMILDIEGLLHFVMEALEKRLDFNRGMIMLANQDKSLLTFTTGYGYSLEVENYMDNMVFHLDIPLERGRRGSLPKTKNLFDQQRGGNRRLPFLPEPGFYQTTGHSVLYLRPHYLQRGIHGYPVCGYPQIATGAGPERP